MKQVRKSFIVGLITILPIVFLGWIGSLFYTPVSKAIGINGIVPLLIGVAIVIVSIIVIGWAFSHIKILRKAKQLIEQQILYRIPGVKIVYKFAKDLLEQVLKNKTYDNTVFVYPYGKYGAREVGILTNVDTGSILVPSAPNPLNGKVYFGCIELGTVKHEPYSGCMYEPTDWTYDQVVKWVMSVGLSYEEKLIKK